MSFMDEVKGIVEKKKKAKNFSYTDKAFLELAEYIKQEVIHELKTIVENLSEDEEQCGIVVFYNRLLSVHSMKRDSLNLQLKYAGTSLLTNEAKKLAEDISKEIENSIEETKGGLSRRYYRVSKPELAERLMVDLKKLFAEDEIECSDVALWRIPYTRNLRDIWGEGYVDEMLLPTEIRVGDLGDKDKPELCFDVWFVMPEQ